MRTPCSRARPATLYVGRIQNFGQTFLKKTIHSGDSSLIRYGRTTSWQHKSSLEYWTSETLLHLQLTHVKQVVFALI